MREDILKIENEIGRLNAKLIALKHSCPHDNAKFFKGTTSGGYYDDSVNYVHLICDDCGLSYTFYEGEDPEYKLYKERI